MASVSAPLVSLPAHIVILPVAPFAASSVGAFFAPLVAPWSGLAAAAAPAVLTAARQREHGQRQRHP